MSALTFRNKLGDLVEIGAVPVTRLKNEFETIFEQVVHNGRSRLPSMISPVPS